MVIITRSSQNNYLGAPDKSVDTMSKILILHLPQVCYHEIYFYHRKKPVSSKYFLNISIL